LIWVCVVVVVVPGSSEARLLRAKEKAPDGRLAEVVRGDGEELV
jgi:hypothetical protein